MLFCPFEVNICPICPPRPWESSGHPLTFLESSHDLRGPGQVLWVSSHFSGFLRRPGQVLRGPPESCRGPIVLHFPSQCPSTLPPRSYGASSSVGPADESSHTQYTGRKSPASGGFWPGDGRPDHVSSLTPTPVQMWARARTRARVCEGLALIKARAR